MTPDDFKTLRLQTGLSQTQLSTEWGVTDRTVRRWEAESVPISPIAAYCLRMMARARPWASGRITDEEVEALLSAVGEWT